MNTQYETLVIAAKDLLQVAEVKMTCVTKIHPSKRIEILQSVDAVSLLRPFFEEVIEYREAMWMLMLNRKNRAIGAYNIGLGGGDSVYSCPRLIFQTALKCNASGIILAHNHPSGELKPSEADKAMTKKVASAGKFLNIKLLDHFIITIDGHYSFAGEGLM